MIQVDGRSLGRHCATGASILPLWRLIAPVSGTATAGKSHTYTLRYEALFVALRSWTATSALC